MKAYYINLDSAADRRKYIESMFAKFASRNWDLIRVPAIDADESRSKKIPGAIKEVEKACLLSHKKALETSLSENDHSLFLEDDASIGPRGFRALENRDLLDQTNVDMVFTSCLIANTDLLLKQYLIYRSAIKHKKTQLFDMKQLHFAGTDAYIVPKGAKAKVLQLFNSLTSFDLPYDLLLKEWIHNGLLKAVVIFPFLSTLSTLADQSLISAPNADWNAFRRLFCIDSEFFVEEAPGAAGEISQSAIDSFTDEYLRLLKMFLTKYHQY